ncbi:LbtU family siderophore porin [Desulfobulbus rhabdoformis]|jgi:hypothetical protein|uniref:LbtU family siderophore porin n=1 Tax=Desulfobulbus rhabdoformis TaxID=34032 RepID=UPI0019638869|nr:LbtU family siderophore porin [Desulfobulbus rhabdoformis]MBM9615436.1 LbtU family siderophore porin [Desulfobulbus rhabdoformis]
MKQITFRAVTALTLGAATLFGSADGPLWAAEQAKPGLVSPIELPRFMHLSAQILNDRLFCSNEYEKSTTPIDTGFSVCFMTDKQLVWAFGKRNRPPLEFAASPLGDTRKKPAEQHLVIQPLHVHLGKYTPLFKQFYTPMGKTRYMSVDGRSQTEQAWLQRQQEAKEQNPANSLERLLSSDEEPESPPIRYRYSMDRSSAVIAGVGWIYDIADTTGMAETFAEMGYDTIERMGAVNLTLGYSYNSFTLTGGYIHAFESRYELEEASREGQKNDPTAWRSQLAYNTRFLNHPAKFAVGYQKSSETLCHYLPEERYTTKASFLLRDRTTLSLEYYKDREYASSDGGNAYGITTKLGFQF